MTAAPIIFVSAVLCVYWSSRTMLLLRGDSGQVDQILETDLSWGRRLLSLR